MVPPWCAMVMVPMVHMFAQLFSAFRCVRNFRSSELCGLRSSAEIHEPQLFGFDPKKLGDFLAVEVPQLQSVGWTLPKPKSCEWNVHLLFFLVLSSHATNLYRIFGGSKVPYGDVTNKTRRVATQRIAPAGWLITVAYSNSLMLNDLNGK